MSSTPISAEPTTGQWLEHLKRETTRFAAVAAAAPLAVHVPTYPAFTVASMSAHLGRALRTFRGLASPGFYDSGQDMTAPAGPAVTGWVMDGLEPLLAVLAEVPPDQPVFLPHGTEPRPASLLAPLLLNEVGMHRWDVESVLGEHQPVPADLAVRYIESVFEDFVPRLASSGVAPIGGTVRLRATDHPARWVISVQDGGLVTRRADGDQDTDATVVVSAPIADLALILWKRWPPPRAGVEITGTMDVLKRLLVTDYIRDPRTTPEH
jgi:uncharacterized protein (TIGR03083 family)